MKRKNKNKLINWVFFGCSAMTIACCVYFPSVATVCCAGFCTGLFTARLLDR